MFNKNLSVMVAGIVSFLMALNQPLLIAAETTVAKYRDNTKAAMALNYDTELYMAGMIHSSGGYNPATAASRAQETVDGWPNIISDCETYGIPVSFNICGYEAVFGDTGRNEVNEIDILHPWHSDAHWSSYTWYSDMPLSGGNYLTVGDLSGYTRSYSLIYGGLLTEQTMNSDIPFEISYHNFGHESLSNIDANNMDATFRLGVAYHRRIGSKLTAEAPPWNNNPQSSKYPIYVQNGIFVFNRMNGSTGEPYEVIEDLWIVPRNGAFNSGTNLTSSIDSVITNGHVLAPYSHPEDGFNTSSRGGFQTSLAYASSKVDSGELWATTLSEIGRYWEAKSNISAVTETVDGNTVVSITLTDYNEATFGIPYLTFISTMPNAENYAKITVDYPSTQTLNSDSNTVRVEDSNAIYTIYLNPIGTTNVTIEGVSAAHTSGVTINKPILTIDSTPPADPCSYEPAAIEATVSSTDEIYAVNIIYQRNSDAKESKIMDYNDGGFWETDIGPFDPCDDVTYYVSVTDNSGRREISQDKNFIVLAGPDSIGPEYSDSSVSSTIAGSEAQFSLRWTDNVGLGGYVFSIDNGTGTFVDDGYVSFSEGNTPASWWDSSWDYRREITVDNTGNAQALADYVVLVEVDTAALISSGKMNADGSDIRFVDDNDLSAIDFWIESGVNTANTRIWVEVPNIPASSNDTVYMYYGNASAPNESNGSATFDFFDDFEGDAAAQADGWNEYKSSYNPILTPEGSEQIASFARILKEGSTWHMYYSYRIGGVNHVGHATSTDFINWTKDTANNPILSPGASGWESSGVWGFTPVKVGDNNWHALYTGRQGGVDRMGHATSTDGLNWTKDTANNPIIEPTEPWEGSSVEMGSLLIDGGVIYAWYHQVTDTPRESGLATSTD
ncbi:MAG: DUF2341 domain-containing protein, partial [Planctomycetota bacterium]